MDIMKIGKNPNYLGGYDLLDSNVSELVLTIKSFSEDDVVSNGRTEKCAVMHFAENYLPMIVNPTNKKTLVRLFKTKETDNYIGKKIAIHTEKVKAFGDVFDALRIKTTLPRTEPEKVYYCENCKSAIKGIGKMNSSQTAAYTKNKYGKMLCAECATEEKKNAEILKNENEVIDAEGQANENNEDKN